jgi:hypothetical protein
MGKGNVAIQCGGELPVVRGGGSVMTHTAGSVTTQSIVQICDGFCSIQEQLV